MTAVLLICTANRCRSPIAESVLRQRIPRSSDITVTSAGLLPGGRPVPPEGIALVSRYGIDLTSHLSRRIAPGQLDGADLVLAMTRSHVRELVATEPAIWPYCFVLKDFVHRLEGRPSIDFRYSPGAALDALNFDRERADLLGRNPSEDMRDPMGASMKVWKNVVSELVDYSARLAELVAGPGERPGGSSRSET
jgi:protein-tyrosine phosphatase